MCQPFYRRPASARKPLEATGAQAILEHWATLNKDHFTMMKECDPWIGRCLAAEHALAEREAELNEIFRVAAERSQALDEIARQLAHWTGRGSAAESALAQQMRSLRYTEQRFLRAESLLIQRDAEVALLAQELAAVRSSATWCWTQRVLQSSPVQLLFGGLIRSAAERRKPPTPPPVSPAPSLPQAVAYQSQSTLPLQDQASPDPVVSNLELRADRMISEHGFLGVPRETFSQAGREQLISLLQEGLRPESRVLEFGCGCLRIGYWLVRFLDAGCYYGIEPARERIDYGLRYLFTPEEILSKRPSFDFNPNFNSSIFGTKFDVFLARSIWTHASKPQIEASLDSFLRDAAPSATFLASYFPAQSQEEDYQGSRWVGTSHDSDTPGVIRHGLPWILDQCCKRGLTCEEIPGFDCDNQLWLRVRRQPIQTD